MVAGRPILVTKDTYAGNLTDVLQCGVTVDYNAMSIRKALLMLRDNPDLCEIFGRNALNAAIKEFNWKMQKQKLINIYNSFKI